MEFICPRNDNECSTCLGIATEAFNTGYNHRHPNVEQVEREVDTENARIKAPLEEDGSLADLDCNERRRRAAIIGEYMGRTAL